jgi:hypothetical protein
MGSGSSRRSTQLAWRDASQEASDNGDQALLASRGLLVAWISFPCIEMRLSLGVDLSMFRHIRSRGFLASFGPWSACYIWESWGFLGARCWVTGVASLGPTSGRHGRILPVAENRLKLAK